VRSHLFPRPPLKRRARPAFLIALAITVVYASVAAWRRANRPGGRWVGMTHCSWRGDPRVTIRPGLAPTESIATVAHESVHVAECRELGPLRYRWNTLFASSNLALEVPAYCAAARVRLKNGWALATVRRTVFEDMRAAMADRLDSATIQRAIVTGCPEIAKGP
jgi:hypothetical protein